MAQQYNPLLKYGFQKTDSGAIADLQAAITELQTQAANLQTALNALKGNKITKVTAAAQLPNIAVGEIFEWQAESQTVDGVDFVNGYFYKSNGATITVTPPVPYIAFTNDFPQNQPYQLGDYNFVFGNYYQVQSYNIDVSSIYTYAYVDTNNTYRFIALKPINSSSNVGDVIFDRVLNVPVTITAVDTVNHTATTDNGQTVNISSVSSSYMLKLWQIGNADGSQSFYMLEPNSHMYYLLVHWDFETNTIIDWFPFQCLRYTSNTPYIFNTVAFSQTDTQPQQLSVVNSIVKYTLSDLITVLNLAQLPNELSSLLNGHLLAWNSSTNLFETKTANGGKYDSFDGTTFANKTIIGCCVHASGNGYNFTYYAAKQSNDNKLTLYGMNNTNTSRDSVTLTDSVTSATVWSAIGATLAFAYFTYI